MLGSSHNSWLLHVFSSQQPCGLPFDKRGVRGSAHLSNSSGDLNLPVLRAQLHHYYGFPLAATSTLFPLQAHWAGPWKVHRIPNGRDMKEKRVGNDQVIRCGMHVIFAAFASRRGAVSFVNVTAREKITRLEFPLRLTNILLKGKQSKATFV